MKKEIIIKLNVESDDEYLMRDEEIIADLAREINCASLSYEIVSVDIKEI